MDIVFIFMLVFVFYIACDINLFLDMFYKNWRIFLEVFEIFIVLFVFVYSVDFCVEECLNWNLLGWLIVVIKLIFYVGKIELG